MMMITDNINTLAESTQTRLGQLIRENKTLREDIEKLKKEIEVERHLNSVLDFQLRFRPFMAFPGI